MHLSQFVYDEEFCPEQSQKKTRPELAREKLAKADLFKCSTWQTKPSHDKKNIKNVSTFGSEGES